MCTLLLCCWIVYTAAAAARFWRIKERERAEKKEKTKNKNNKIEKYI